MRFCARGMMPAAAGVAIAVVVAGCGGGANAGTHAPKKTTIAEVCKQHRAAAATVTGGLVAYETYMRSEDPAFLLTFAKSGIARKVEPAVKTLERASGPAAATNTGRRFFKDLARLAGWLEKPVAVPSAVLGDRNSSRIEADAKAVGCAI